MSAFIAAIRLLTILPTGSQSSSDRAISRSPVFFPLVGALIGLVAAWVWTFTDSYVPGQVAAALAVTVLVVLTGALHIDGLADTIDGLFGGRTKDRKLEIMSDPSVGAYGATAIVLSLLLRWVILASLNPDDDWLVLVISTTLSRSTVACMMTIFPYSRNQGIGSVYAASRWLVVPVAVLFAATLAFALGTGGGLVAVGFAGITGLAVALYVRRKIDGLTGDVYGAIVELAEIAALLGMVANISTTGTIW